MTPAGEGFQNRNSNFSADEGFQHQFEPQNTWVFYSKCIIFILSSINLPEVVLNVFK